MVEPVTINLQHVARDLRLPLPQVQAAVELLDDGNTVPFITRYRKDQTGGLDEEQIRRIQERLQSMRLLAERKQTILRSIESQGKLTEKLGKQIRAATTTKRLEDLYLPFKPKKQTLATLARSRGLEPLAHEILAAAPLCADLDARAADFADTDKDVATPADALLGAGHILAEQFSERADLRQRLRDVVQRTGVLVSAQVVSATKAQESKPQEAKAEGTKPGEAKPQDEPAPAKPEEPSEAVAEAPVDQPAEPAEAPAEVEPAAKAPVADVPDAEAATDVSATATPTAGTPVPDAEPATDAPSSPEAEGTGASDAAVAEAAPEAVEQAPGTADTAPAEAVEAVASETRAVESSEPPASEPLVESVAEVTEPAPPSDAAAEGPATETAAEPPAAKQPAAGASSAKAASRGKQPATERLTRAQFKKKQAQEKKLKAFSDYFDYREQVKKVPPHRVLAINRGERARILRVKVEVDVKAAEAIVDELLIPTDHPHGEFLRGCGRDALNRLILPSLERELRREMTDKAEHHAVEVFAKNLRNLLLQPPIRDSRVLAVDPGYRSGCKLVALDQFGNVLGHDVIYLVGKSPRKPKAKETVIELIDRFGLAVVVIGNGTACRETEDFFAGLLSNDLKDRDLAYVIVNEAGASVYSTSRLGREEFPEYDATVRGAVSIGRRLQDPLSELVKIEPARIGVGLYQHDVKARHLHSSLDEVVESCVNYVGVSVNTASPALLRYVSGLNQLTARRIYEHRMQHGPFRNRAQLKNVPGIGDATFVQAAGFLKIAGGDEPLDSTWIHPESYEVTTRVLSQLGYAAGDLADKPKLASLSEKAAAVDLTAMAEQLEIGVLLLKDILAQFARPGRDPREDLPKPVFKRGILKLEDLEVGMVLHGTVLNVVDFGAFVDIGMHDSGLVHISQLANQFVRDPHDVVAVGDIVKVWVVEVNKERRRVSLTMIPPGTKPPERPARRGRGKPEGEASSDKPAGSRERRSDGPGRPRGKPGGKPGGRPSGKAGGRPGGRGKGQRFQKSEYRPKPRPKPVVPITKKMVTGAEPMRTFGDLAQFYEIKQTEEPETLAESKAETAKVKTDQVETSKTEAGKVETDQVETSQAEAGKVEMDQVKTDKVEASKVDAETAEPRKAAPETVAPQEPAVAEDFQAPAETNDRPGDAPQDTPEA